MSAETAIKQERSAWKRLRRVLSADEHHALRAPRTQRMQTAFFEWVAARNTLRSIQAAH